MDPEPRQRCTPVPRLVAPAAEAAPHFAEVQPTAPDSAGRFVARRPEWPGFAASNASAASLVVEGVDLVAGAAGAVGVVATAEAAGIVAAAAAEQRWLGLASAAAEMLVVVVGMPVAVEAPAAGAVVGAVAVAS